MTHVKKTSMLAELIASSGLVGGDVKGVNLKVGDRPVYVQIESIQWGELETGGASMPEPGGTIDEASALEHSAKGHVNIPSICNPC